MNQNKKKSIITYAIRQCFMYLPYIRLFGNEPAIYLCNFIMNIAYTYTI